MSGTPYPPTDYTAVLSAKRGLTAEFGMGSGDPPLSGSAHGRCSRGHPSGTLAVACARTSVPTIVKLRRVSEEELGLLVALA